MFICLCIVCVYIHSSSIVSEQSTFENVCLEIYSFLKSTFENVCHEIYFFLFESSFEDVPRDFFFREYLWECVPPSSFRLLAHHQDLRPGLVQGLVQGFITCATRFVPAACASSGSSACTSQKKRKTVPVRKKRKKLLWGSSDCPSHKSVPSMKM